MISSPRPTDHASGVRSTESIAPRPARASRAIPRHQRLLVAAIACLCYLLSPQAAATQGAAPVRERPPTTLEILYQAPSAEGVSLIWGVGDWALVPEEQRPKGTTVQGNVMYTPMERRGNVFATALRMPTGTIITYGFLATFPAAGAGVGRKVWDGDYVASARGGSLAFHTPRRRSAMRLRWLALGLSVLCFVLGIIVGQAWAFSRTLVRYAGRSVAIELRISPVRVTVVLGTLVLLTCGVLLTTSTAFRSLSPLRADCEGFSPLGGYVLHKLSSSDENVVASWYSGTLLLLSSAMAGLCALVDTRRFRTSPERLYAGGWLVIAVVFAVLSLDEVGSFHERIGTVSSFAEMLLVPFQGETGLAERARRVISLTPLGGHVALAVPIGVVAFFLLAFAWVRLRRHPAAFLLMILGTALFMSVPFYERVEHRLLRVAALADWTAFDRLIWLEEGTEMFGMLAFVGAMVMYLAGASEKVRCTGRSLERVVAWRASLGRTLAVQVAILCVMGVGFLAVEVVQPYLLTDDEGIPENWFPMALAGIAALTCLFLWDGRRGAGRRVYLGSAALNVMLSAYYGVNVHGYLYQPSVERLGSWIHAGLGAAALILSLGLARQARERWSRVGGVTWAAVLCCAFAAGPDHTVALGFTAFAVLIPSLLVHFEQSLDD